MRLSIGIPGSTDPAVVRRIAPRAEELGYRALWVNDTAAGDSLAVLSAAAEVTSTLGLATGVIPIDRHGGATIAARVRELRLPLERLRVGLGSGSTRRGGLAGLESGIAELRAGCPAPVVTGALGPRTRRLAARIADGILFNWLTADAGADAMTQLRVDAGARRVEGVFYARAITDPAARDALTAEVARYAGIAQYAANFLRTGIDPRATTIDLSSGVEALGEWENVADELVLRLVPRDGSPERLEESVEALSALRL